MASAAIPIALLTSIDRRFCQQDQDAVCICFFTALHISNNLNGFLRISLYFTIGRLLSRSSGITSYAVINMILISGLALCMAPAISMPFIWGILMSVMTRE